MVDWIQGSGQVQSSGEFTLEVPAQRASIVADPRDSILKLIQWGVASGAKLVRVELGRRSTRVCHDGSPVDPSQLTRALISPLLVSDRALRHLALGLLATMNLNPDSIWLDHPQGRWEVLTRQDHPAPPTADIALTIEGIRAPSGWPPEFSSLPVERSCRRHNSLARWLSGLTRIYAAELLRQRCGPAGVPILLNGVPLNEPLGTRARLERGQVRFEIHESFPGYWTYRYLLADSASGGLLAPPVDCPKFRAEWLMVGPAEHDHRPMNPAAVAGTHMAGKSMLNCHAAFQLGGPAEAIGWVGWVSDGVAIELSAMKTPGGVFADASGLKTDASGLKLVHDEAYQERLDWLQHWSRAPASLVDDASREHQR